MDRQSTAQVISLDDIRGRNLFQPEGRQEYPLKTQLTLGAQPSIEGRSSQIDLFERVVALEKELKEVKQLLHNFLDTEDFIELRDINFGESKEEIARYFREHDGEDIGYEELIENLRFDPKYVVQACNELAEEGKIG